MAQLAKNWQHGSHPCGCAGDNTYTLWLQTDAGPVAYSWGGSLSMTELGLQFKMARIASGFVIESGKKKLAPIRQRTVLLEALDAVRRSSVT